jgi:hypothetical protein
MLTIKRKNVTWTILSLLGFVYFCSMSNMVINPFWRSEMTFISLQAVALISVTYFRLIRR